MKRHKRTAAFALSMSLCMTSICSVPSMTASSAIEETAFAEIESVSVDKESIRVGETAQINIKWNDETLKKPSVDYDTQGWDIINLSSKGVIRGIAVGETKIIVKANGKSFTIEYTVLPALSGECGENASWSLDEETGVLTISGEGAITDENHPDFFDLRKSIKKIVVEEGITSLEDSLFSLCLYATSMELPSTLSVFDPLVALTCMSLEEINVSPDNMTYTSVDGVLLSKDKSTLVKYPNGKADEKYTIPDSVEEISPVAFALCKKLKEVVIPESVNYIYENFSDCRLLENVTFPEHLEYISGLSFGSTPWLNAQREIDPYVIVDGFLIDARTVTGEAVIPENVDVIADCAFSGNIELTSVKFNDKIDSIGIGVFSNCEKLEKIEFTPKISSIGYAALSGTGIKEIVIPDNIHEIDEYAFCDSSALEAITILDPECRIFDAESTICTSDPVGKTTYYNGVIRGYNGSTVQAYAEKYNYKFESLEDAPISTTTTASTTTTTTTSVTTTTTASSTSSAETTTGETATTSEAVTTVPETTTYNETTTSEATTTTSESTTSPETTTLSDTTTITTTIAESTTAAETTTAETLKPTLYGDANNNGKVEIADAVLIMQSIANKDEFGVGGSNEFAMTPQGKANADCYQPGSDITGMDALAVQRKLVNLVELPEYPAE